MPDVPGRTLPARKRQRQAVVCTGCRRRKIACDRKAPCAQCVQAHLECTYYARNDFQTDSRHSTKAKSQSSLSASSAQAMDYQSYSSGPPSESLANLEYQKNFSVPDLMVASTIPAAHSVDMSASSWFDTEILGTFNQPLSTPIDVSPKTLFPDTVTALSDPSRETGQPAAFPPQASLYSEVFSAEPGKILFSKSRLYGSTHWITILGKVCHTPTEIPRHELQICFHKHAYLTSSCRGRVTDFFVFFEDQSTSNKACSTTSLVFYSGTGVRVRVRVRAKARARARAIHSCRNARDWRDK